MEQKESTPVTTDNDDTPQFGEVIDAPIEYLEDQNILGWMKEQAMLEKVH